MNLITYFRHIKLADRLPPLPRQYSTDFDSKQLSEDESTLMKMSALRSPQGVEILKKRHKATDAKELVSTLPHKHKARRGERLMPLLRRIAGTMRYDPMKQMYRRYRGRGYK